METSIRDRTDRRIVVVVVVGAVDRWRLMAGDTVGSAHYGRLGSPGTMNTRQGLRGPRRRQRIAAISAIHVARYTSGFDGLFSAVVHQDPSSF